jgi:hypothetical protein
VISDPDLLEVGKDLVIDFNEKVIYLFQPPEATLQAYRALLMEVWHLDLCEIKNKEWPFAPETTPDVWVMKPGWRYIFVYDLAVVEDYGIGDCPSE